MSDDVDPVMWFEALLEHAWVACDERGNPLVDFDTDPYGLGLQMFVADTPSGLPSLPASFRYSKLEGDGMWSKLDRLARDGATSVKLKVDGTAKGVGDIACMFCASPTDLLADPAAITLSDGEETIAAFDRVGLIDLAQDAYTYWRPFHRIDCVVAHLVPQEAPAFAYRTEDTKFWELAASGDRRPLFTTSAELAKWTPALGHFAIFTSEEDAGVAAQLLVPHRFFGPRGEPVDSAATVVAPVSIPSLRDWLKSIWARNQFRTTKVVVDPHSPRHYTGVIDPAVGPYVRTSRGLWTIGDDNRIRLDHVCHVHHGRDSFHWDGAFGWSVEEPIETYGPSAGTLLERTRVLSRAERKRVSATPRSLQATPPAVLGDAFVLVATDTLTGDLSFRFFEDHLAALRWLVRYEQECQRPWNTSGRFIDRERFRRPLDVERRDALSGSFNTTISALIEESISEDFALPFARRLAAYVNHLFDGLRVEVCGYATDVAYALRDRSLESALFTAALGADAPAVLNRMVARGDFEITSAARRRCVSHLGETACALLSPLGLWFLSAGLAHLEDAKRNGQADQAGAVMGMTRALETELGLLLDAARVQLLERSPREDDNTPLGRYLNGGRALTLGEFVHYLRKKEEADSVHSGALCDAFRELGASVVLEKHWWARLKSLTLGIRNKAAHTDAVRLEDAAKCEALVLGEANAAGLLPSLLTAWKHAEPLSEAVEIRGRRSIEVDHIAAVFTADEVADYAAEPGDSDGGDADDATEALQTIDGAQLSRWIDGLIHLFKSPDGPLVLMTSSTADDGVVDLIQRFWSRERVQQLAKALSRRVVRWSGQGDEMFSTGGDRLTLRFRLGSGGAAVLNLSADGRAELSRTMTELAEGRYGVILPRHRPPDTRELADLAEAYWETLRRSRNGGDVPD